jgi:hypothetical protein
LHVKSQDGAKFVAGFFELARTNLDPPYHRRHEIFERRCAQLLHGYPRLVAQDCKVAWSPVYRIGWMQSLRQGAMREQRARSHELQQTAAADDVDMVWRHDCPLNKELSANSIDEA